MATRSIIGIENKNKSIDSIYCHWDGYPQNNGKILFENYNSREKARFLINQGWNSTLENSVLLNALSRSKKSQEDNEEGPTFDKFKDLAAFLKHGDSVAQFMYLYTDDEGWIYWESGAYYPKRNRLSDFFKVWTK